MSVLVNVRLDQKLKLINLQGANFVRFYVAELDFIEPEVVEKNAFERLLNGATELKLPKKCTVVNNVVDAVCQSKLNIGFTHGEGTTGTNFFVFFT